MPFSLRRRSASHFKHIAHGLVPAATVAPRPAVPRTPPPRSPYPSPERPRSALAAAILMTSLTGRTVAIPQPRQRSFSESDSAYREQKSYIEPYATASELGIGEKWKFAGRGHLPSPEMSDDDYEPENMVESLSDIEKESIYYLSEKKDENLSALYAVPYKVKKEIVSSATIVDAEESEISSQEVEPQSIVNELKTGAQELKNAVVAEMPRSFVGTANSDEFPRRNNPMKNDQSEQVDQTKEEMEGLKSRNRELTEKTKHMVMQLQELRLQIKRMKSKLKELECENRKLQEAVENKNMSDDFAELLLLRQQAQELVDENDSLKMTVHRLTVELSCYQTKYRPVSKLVNAQLGGLPMRGPPPPWLLDMKYLSPLLLAYEDRMREKDAIVLAAEEEMKNFKDRVAEVVNENEELHQQLERKKPVTSKEWEHLQTQAKLVLEENQVLMKQVEVQQAKAKDSHNRHIQEVTKLTKQIMLLEAKKQSQEEELTENQKQLETLRVKYDELKTNLNGKVAAEEHVALVNELKSQLQVERDKRNAEIEDLMGRLAAMQAEKKSLLLEKNDLTADNKTLEAELEMAQKANRKSQKKIGLLKQQVEEAMEKEMVAHQYLANLIGLAENIAQERDELIQMAKGLETEKHCVLNKIMAGNMRLGRLEEKVKVYKKKAAVKLGDVNQRLIEQEKDFEGKAAQYHRELKHLQRLLHDRQETLDEVLQQKRQVEDELEIVWESTSNENRRIKEHLYKSLGGNLWNSQKNNLEEIVHKDSMYDYDFNYCDVKFSSPLEVDTKQEFLN
ncbi:LOW QUALITY PROTEIN: centrosomal protein of 89 kDa [Microcaecilia unicolor]|uniref:LOW QUALITY PROTEIN: centrosomal protein of 89 kDa n=1 Tax=Microcaecilia unicolor TaxID=1415580 RepID=A0A6P7YBT2_9AMPH|nr:LOW QUALITY PROTEIN: centrosomal protein of 89 kDa [Microcaecilia unicolor]